MTGIYIHIPFCISKCPYCDFYSFNGDEKQKDSYLDAVLSSLERYKGRITEIDTVYIGGGTPSVFGGERLSRIIEYIRECFTLVNPEITVECNPSSVDAELMKALAGSGVNRISMGMQSAVDSERKALGRHSDKKQVEKALSIVRESGISNISLDIMLGIPGQTLESLDESLDFLLASGVTHISAYMLKVEADTPFWEMGDSLILPDEDTVCQLYLHTSERLTEQGYCHYEISNFAKKGFESRHNTKYWKLEPYVGIGPTAYSFFEGQRFFTPRCFDDFLEEETFVYDGEGGDEEEYIMLALRLAEGLREEDFRRRFGRSIPEEMYRKAEKYGPDLVTVGDGSIALTPQGFLISNTIIVDMTYERS